MKTIYFAGGCFWGMEKLMSLVEGVADAQSGYANGHTEHPSYEQVCAGNTGHRETVKVDYDETVIGLAELTGLFFSVIDPTVKNRQAHDIGTQYQTGIYWDNEEDAALIKALAEEERAKQPAFYVELEPLRAFWPAEAYHQDYLVKNPQGYCHIGPKDFERARKLKR